MTKSQIPVRFVALICNKRKLKFQLKVSENEGVILFQFKFTDLMEVTAGFDSVIRSDLCSWKDKPNGRWGMEGGKAPR